MIGLFGGTFDPVHFGHLRCAWEVMESLEIGDFRWLPAGQPPHRNGPVRPATHRLAMLELALAGVREFSIDRRELDRSGPSYMVDTLGAIRGEAGSESLCLVIGQDNARTLSSWHRWEELFDLAHLVVMHRPGSRGSYPIEVAAAMHRRAADDPAELRKSPAGRVWHQRVSQFDIASSSIRAMIAAGRSPRFLLPAPVLAYIEKNGLYASAGHA